MHQGGGAVMQTIRTSRGAVTADALPQAVMRALPYRLSDEIRRSARTSEIEEIRMRAKRRCSLVIGGKNYMLETVLEPDEFAVIIETLTKQNQYITLIQKMFTHFQNDFLAFKN